MPQDKPASRDEAQRAPDPADRNPNSPSREAMPPAAKDAIDRATAAVGHDKDDES